MMNGHRIAENVASRSLVRQATEVGIRCRALNIMTHQGIPQSERIAVYFSGLRRGSDPFGHTLPSCNNAP